MSLLDTVIEEEVIPNLKIRLRESAYLGFPYAINVYVGSTKYEPYYFKTLKEAEEFYAFKLVEIRQVFKFAEGGVHGDS